MQLALRELIQAATKPLRQRTDANPPLLDTDTVPRNTIAGEPSPSPSPSPGTGTICGRRQGVGFWGLDTVPRKTIADGGEPSPSPSLGTGTICGRWQGVGLRVLGF
jgi:hypothetical protein